MFADEAPCVLQGEVQTGDAFDLVQDLPVASVDLVLTSPPSWGLRSYGLQDATSRVLERWSDAGLSPLVPPPYEWYRESGGVLGLEPYPSWYTAHLVEFFN